MSSLITPRRRNAWSGGDPTTSESLKGPFLKLIGKDYTSVACRRMNLPYNIIAAWLNGNNLLSDALQAAVSKEIADAASKPEPAVQVKLPKAPRKRHTRAMPTPSKPS